MILWCPQHIHIHTHTYANIFSKKTRKIDRFDGDRGRHAQQSNIFDGLAQQIPSTGSPFKQIYTPLFDCIHRHSDAPPLRIICIIIPVPFESERSLPPYHHHHGQTTRALARGVSETKVHNNNLLYT